jgi:hypothetical protein
VFSLPRFPKQFLAPAAYSGKFTYIRLVSKPYGDTMKTLIAAVLALSIAAPAIAGGIAPVIVEPEVIVEETSSTSAGGIVPLLLLLLVAAAVATAD